MNRPAPQIQWNDYVGSAAVDRPPQKLQLEDLLTLDDHAVIGFEWGVVPSGPELTLFVVHLRAAASTIEAVQQQGGIVQCFTYVVEDWTEGFDQLFDRYFAEARIRVWDDSVLGERDVQIIGEQV